VEYERCTLTLAALVRLMQAGAAYSSVAAPCEGYVIRGAEAHAADCVAKIRVADVASFVSGPSDLDEAPLSRT
jgi:hypothetical protein